MERWTGCLALEVLVVRVNPEH
jgi:hypothetical protein